MTDTAIWRLIEQWRDGKHNELMLRPIRGGRQPTQMEAAVAGAYRACADELDTALRACADKETVMSDRRTEGLYGKFEVRRTDGRDAPGEKHEGCTYFVLDLQHDKHMPTALHAYADSCASEYPVLASQLHIVANDFGSRAEFAGIMAQKPALDLERQRLRACAEAPASETENMLLCKDDEHRFGPCSTCGMPHLASRLDPVTVSDVAWATRSLPCGPHGTNGCPICWPSNAIASQRAEAPATDTGELRAASAALDEVVAPDPSKSLAQRIRDEFADFKMLMDHLTEVYVHFSRDRISKPNTLPSEVILVAEDFASADIEEAIKEAREKWRAEALAPSTDKKDEEANTDARRGTTGDPQSSRTASKHEVA